MARWFKKINKVAFIENLMIRTEDRIGEEFRKEASYKYFSAFSWNY